VKGKIRNFTVLIEQDEDGIFVAKVPDIQGCYTQGKTVAQAMERVREAIQVCLESDPENSKEMKNSDFKKFIKLAAMPDTCTQMGEKRSFQCMEMKNLEKD